MTIPILCLAAALMDFALYLFFGVLYFFVIELGGGSEDLGHVAAAGGICYVLAAIGGGRLSDRVPRLVLARVGSVVFACLVVAVSLCRSIPPIFLLFMPMGVSMGFFWPPVQARLADLAGPEKLASVTGRFNIYWSVGKGLGFLAAGALVEIFGGLGTMGALLATFLVAAAAGLAPYLLLSGGGRAPPGGGGPAAGAGTAVGAPPQDRLDLQLRHLRRRGLPGDPPPEVDQ